MGELQAAFLVGELQAAFWVGVLALSAGALGGLVGGAVVLHGRWSPLLPRRPRSGKGWWRLGR